MMYESDTQNERNIRSQLESLATLYPEVEAEVTRARRKHQRDFISHHEAYAVIKEEFEEWWDTVKVNKPDSRELLSVAAMALLAIVELGPHPQDQDY